MNALNTITLRTLKTAARMVRDGVKQGDVDGKILHRRWWGKLSVQGGHVHRVPVRATLALAAELSGFGTYEEMLKIVPAGRQGARIMREIGMATGFNPNLYKRADKAA